MSSKMEKLKELNAQKKQLAEEQKALREELNAGKEERKGARKAQAEARKAVRAAKSKLGDLSASVMGTLKSGESEAIADLADNITEVSAELSAAVRAFGEAAEKLEDL